MRVYFVYPSHKDSDVIYTRPLKTFSKKEDAEEWVRYNKNLSKRIRQELNNIDRRIWRIDTSNYPTKNESIFEENDNFICFVIANTLKEEGKFTTKELKIISAYSYHFHNQAPKNFHLFDEYKIYSERVY